jgi:precorrin-8X/cobalt-precorrin-8 methylmutase
MPLFDAYVMVDWSAANTPGPIAGSPNGIWIAVAEEAREPTVVPQPTRHAAADTLTAELLRLVEAGRRVLVGFDFTYGYPRGTAAALGLDATIPPWRAMWEHLAATITDDACNRSNRFDAATRLNARVRASAGPGPFWGLPAGRTSAGPLLPTKPVFPFPTSSGLPLAEWRAVERSLRAAGHRPKSAWQLYGAGSVGSQALVGIPHLARVRFHPGLVEVSAVWPFETGFVEDPTALGDELGPAVVHAEVYPSLLTPAEDLHPVADARQVLALVGACREMDRKAMLGAAFAPGGKCPADRAAAETEEGWVLSVEQPAVPGGVDRERPAGDSG